MHVQPYVYMYVEIYVYYIHTDMCVYVMYILYLQPGGYICRYIYVMYILYLQSGAYIRMHIHSADVVGCLAVMLINIFLCIFVDAYCIIVEDAR